jgi:hypothetical protein
LRQARRERIEKTRSRRTWIVGEVDVALISKGRHDMIRNSIVTKLFLPVLAVIAVGLFGLGVSGQVSSGRETNTIYGMTDVHDRVDLAQILGANATKVNGLSDAHDRARAGQTYQIAGIGDKKSDLSDRHAVEELRALFWR